MDLHRACLTQEPHLRALRVAPDDRIIDHDHTLAAHDLALVEVGPGAASPRQAETGLFHFCFDVSDERALADIHRRCLEAGVDVLGTADHTVMRSYYVRDPDGHVVELGFDVPVEEWAGAGDAFARDKVYSIPPAA